MTIIGRITLIFLALTQSVCASKPIIIQASKFPQHFKVAIKWKEEIPYQVEQNGTETIIVFDRDTDFQQLGFNNIPKFIESIETSNIEGSFVTRLKIAETSELKFGWINGNFTLDVLNSPLKKSRKLNVRDPHKKEEPTATKKGKGKKQLSTLKFAQRVGVHAQTRDEKPQLVFEWDKPVKAAAVHWGENLIIAFDHPALFDLSKTIASDTKIFRKLSQFDIANKSVLILPLSDLYNPSLRHEKNKWIIQINKTASQALKTNLNIVSREQGADTGESILFEAKDLGDLVTLNDPETGLKLTLIPSRNLTAREERYPQFNIMPSLQGISILHKGQNVTVQNAENGFLIRSPNPLYVSNEEDINRLRDIGHPDPLIKLTTFKKPEDYSFSNERKKFETKILKASGDSKTRLHFEFAHFYLSEGYFREALSEINIAISEDQTLLKKPEVRALRALTAILDDDNRTATKDIHSAPLQDEPEANFLKAFYRVKTDKSYKEPYKLLKNNIGIFKFYPEKIRNRLALIAAESAVQTGHTPLPFIKLIKEDSLGPSDLELSDFYEAKALLISGKTIDALAQFRELQNAKNPEVRVRSTLHVVQMGLKNKTTSPPDAIKALEEVRFMWTGDETELQVFSLLGELYAREKNYTQAMRIYREAYRGLTYIPTSKDLYPKLVELFTENLLENEKIQPLDLVIFYEEFHSFSPEDKRKTLVQLKMIESYIALDLLENAQNMLEKLLSSVEGEALKKSSEFLLADVYVRDHKFKKALDLMKDHKAEDLSEPLQEKRYLLTFKALLGLDLYDQVQELIDENDDVRDTRLQRLELSWQRKDWKIAQGILSSLVLSKGKENPQDPSLLLNYAIAAFFNEDHRELKELRTVFLDEMKNTEQSEAFELLTSEEKELEMTKLSLAQKLSDLSTFRKFVSRMQGDGGDVPARG